MVTGDDTFYAGWEEGYVLTLDSNCKTANGADESKQICAVKKDTAYQHSVNIPTNANSRMVFTGWYTDKDAKPESKVEDLKYRVKIMNEVSPILAVSIHQNSYHEENVFGAQVFYYQTSTEGEKAAGIIQDALQKVNPDNTKKIKANDTYYILKKTEVPTVIVECGFLSNYKEAQKLVTEDYQKSVAEAVAEGILSYIKENE